MTYLPQSLTVFGGGVIASEYAATFACLGVRVVMIDKYATPLGFLDADLVSGFTREFEQNGGEFRGDSTVQSVEWDGVSKVITVLDDGTVIESDKALVAQGRVANTDTLGLDAAGVVLSDRGLIEVNGQYQTCVDWIYAVGDAIGPPALASSSMKQGRSAAFHALGKPQPEQELITPMGIYTIPEIGCVGLSEAQAIAEHGEVLVGRVNFNELARAQIIAASNGMLKIVADIHGKQILGVQIVGDGATELVHLGQMAMIASLTVDDLAASIFNFPTLAEAYRAAALDVIIKRQKQRRGNSEITDNATVGCANA
jgi:NAD(P) transhydrogenase